MVPDERESRVTETRERLVLVHVQQQQQQRSSATTAASQPQRENGTTADKQKEKQRKLLPLCVAAVPSSYTHADDQHIINHLIGWSM
mmetsp:Transcript_26360/g.73694  ORF Transcript_26360/g.73694 Transcript_26360/m.73694 type:complete len:87 (+) Transcript_26360:2730-2990(+)